MNDDFEKLAERYGVKLPTPPTPPMSPKGEPLRRAARKLGVDPADLGAIISFETGGTFDPHKVGGEGNKYKGLIQFGPEEQKTYYNPKDTFDTQVEDGVVRYFQDRFKKAGRSTQGASLEDLYTTVIAGNPKANRNAKDSFGTSALSGTERILKEHRPKVVKEILGGQPSPPQIDFDKLSSRYLQGNEFSSLAERYGVAPTQPLVEGQKPLLRPGQPLGTDLPPTNPTGVPLQTGVTAPVAQPVQPPIQQQVQQPVPPVQGKRRLPQKRFVTGEPVISEVPESPANLQTGTFTRETANDAIADVIEMPDSVKTASQANEYVKGQLRAKYPNIQIPDNFTFAKKWTKGTGAVIDYATLKQMGVDTDALVSERIAQERVGQEQTPNLKMPVMPEAEAEKALDARIRSTDYAGQQRMAEFISNPANLILPIALWNSYNQQGDVLREDWVDSQKKKLIDQYGSYGKALQAEEYYKNSDWAETVSRMARQTAGSFAKNLFSGTAKSIATLGQEFEDANPLNLVLPDKAKIGVRNLVNGADFLTRLMTAPTAQDAVNEMEWASGNDISKQQLYRAAQEFDKAIGDDPVLKGRFLGSLADAGGSALAFVALGAVMPAMRTTNFWGKTRDWSTAIAGAVQSAGSGYEEGKGQGLSESDARKFGVIQGLLGTSEMVGAGAELTSFLKDPTLRRHIANALLEVGQGVKREAKQEFAQEVFQTTSGRVVLEYLKDNDPSTLQKLANALNKLPIQIAEAVTNEGITAAITGGLMGGAGTAAQVQSAETAEPVVQPLAPQTEVAPPVEQATLRTVEDIPIVGTDVEAGTKVRLKPQDVSIKPENIDTSTERVDTVNIPEQKPLTGIPDKQGKRQDRIEFKEPEAKPLATIPEKKGKRQDKVAFQNQKTAPLQTIPEKGNQKTVVLDSPKQERKKAPSVAELKQTEKGLDELYGKIDIAKDSTDYGYTSNQLAKIGALIDITPEGQKLTALKQREAEIQANHKIATKQYSQALKEREKVEKKAKAQWQNEAEKLTNDELIAKYNELFYPAMGNIVTRDELVRKEIEKRGLTDKIGQGVDPFKKLARTGEKAVNESSGIRWVLDRMVNADQVKGALDYAKSLTYEGEQYLPSNLLWDISQNKYADEATQKEARQLYDKAMGVVSTPREQLHAEKEKERAQRYAKKKITAPPKPAPVTPIQADDEVSWVQDGQTQTGIVQKVSGLSAVIEDAAGDTHRVLLTSLKRPDVIEFKSVPQKTPKRDRPSQPALVTEGKELPKPEKDNVIRDGDIINNGVKTGIYREIDGKKRVQFYGGTPTISNTTEYKEGKWEKGEGDLMESARPEFYSQLERTIEQKMPAKASAEQVRGIIKDTKQEERDWLGIDQWLDEHPTATKEEVLQFVRENNAKIEVVEKGKSVYQPQFDITQSEDTQGNPIWQVKLNGKFLTALKRERFPTEDDVQNYASRHYRDANIRETDDTKFSQYVLPGGPLSRDTEIFTATGWKRIDSVLLNEEILTRQDNTGILEWQPIEALPTVFAEQLYHFKNQSIDMQVTPYHQMVVKKRRRTSDVSERRITAEQLWAQSEMLVPLTGEWVDGADGQLFNRDAGDVAEFVGWYLAEGSYKHKNGHKHTLQIAQSRTANPDKCARLETLFNRLGFAWKYYGEAYGIGSRQLPKGLAELLHNQPTSKDKYIPPFFFKSSRRVIGRLLLGLIGGDGFITPATTIRKARIGLATMSSRLAGDVQGLIVLLGFRASVRQRKTGLYIVTINTKRFAGIDDAKHAIVEYNDTAFCVTVRNHAIYVRRNGVAAFTGNSNYREMLLTLPPSKDSNAWTIDRQNGKYVLRKPDGTLHTDSQGNIATWSNPTSAEAAVRSNQRSGDTFKSSHFDEPNILVHIRFDDRAVDGKKILHIAEIQSDWHQAGRKKGYVSDVPQAKERLAELRKDMEATFEPSWGAKDITSEERDARIKRNQEKKSAFNQRPDVIALQQIINAPRVAGQVSVPDAPFKKSWHELALKKMLRYAAENGYDAISWDTGETQADRYDLSKQIKEIEYIKRGDKYELGVTAINGDGVDLPQKSFTADELENVVGKEVAQKIIDGEGKQYRGHEGRTLEGLDLKVGGEGMKGFYDKILPAFANKYTKKWGGKVTEGIAGKPEYVKSYEGIPLDEIRQLIKDPFDPYTVTTTHQLNITPAMRESVMQGQPMFAVRQSDVQANERSFENAKKLDIEELLPLVDMKDIEHTDEGILEVNDIPAYELVRRTLATAMNASPDFNGVFTDPDQVNAFVNTAERLAGQADAVGQDGQKFRDLAKMVKQVAKTDGSVIFLLSKEALPHEIVHKTFYFTRDPNKTRENQIPTDQLEAMAQTPIFKHIQRALGWRSYKKKKLATQMEEAATHIVRGEWDVLNIDTEEQTRDAARLALAYLKAFAKQNAREGKSENDILKILAKEITYAEEVQKYIQLEGVQAEREADVQGAEDSNVRPTRRGTGETVSEKYRPSGEERLSQTPISAREKANIPLKDDPYISASNATQQDFANTQLAKGLDKATDWFNSQVEDGNLNNGATGVVGLNLLNAYAQQGRYAEMDAVAEKLVPMIRSAAQSVQAMRILAKFNPEKALAYATMRKMARTGLPLTDREINRLTPKIENLNNAEIDKAAVETAITELQNALERANAEIADLEQAIKDAEKPTTETKESVTKKIPTKRELRSREELEKAIRKSYGTDLMESVRDDSRQDIVDLIALDILDYKTPAETLEHIEVLTGNALTQEEFASLQLEAWNSLRPPAISRSAEQQAKLDARTAHRRLAFQTRGQKQGPKKPNVFEREVLAQGTELGYTEQEITGAILLPQLRGDNARQQWYQAMGGHNPELFKRSFDLRQTVLKNIRDQRAQAKAEREGFTGSLGQFENELRHRDMALREARLQLQREYDKIERSTGEHLLYGVEEAVNLFKGLSAWGEVSYILRQGFIPLVTDTRAALKGDWQGVGHGLQGDNELWKWIGDKAGFDQAVQYLGDHSLSMFISKIRQHPRFLEAQNNGVRFTQIGDFNIADDHFSTKLLDAVPLYKRAEVAYTLPGDLQRLFIYDSWAKYIEGQNLSEVDERKAKKYAAETANAFTGKGNIAKLISREGALAKLASITFFSPQLLISRFQSAYRLSTGFATAPKGMRLQMAKKGARFYGLLALMLYLAGASLDPEDDDFGTLNVKKDSRLAKAIPDARDLHIDMLAGLDVPIQNGLRLFMGLGKAVMNNDRAYFNDAVLASWRQLGVNKQGEPRFLRSKLSPSASMIADWYTGKDYLGRPFSYWGAISSRVSPLAWQQTYDALLYDRLDAMKTEKQTPMTAREKLANERKWDNALVMLLGTFTGVGITQYPKDEKSKAMELASTLSDAVSKKDDETRRVEGVLRKLFKAQQEALVDGGNTSKVNAEINDWINKHPQLKSETKRLLGEAKSKTGLFSYYVKDLTLPELQRVQKVATGDELEVVNQMIKKVEKKKK